MTWASCFCVSCGLTDLLCELQVLGEVTGAGRRPDGVLCVGNGARTEVGDGMHAERCEKAMGRAVPSSLLSCTSRKKVTSQLRMAAQAQAPACASRWTRAAL